MSYEQFSTGAKVSQVRSVLGPKCLKSEMSQVRNVCTPRESTLEPSLPKADYKPVAGHLKMIGF